MPVPGRRSARSSRDRVALGTRGFRGTGRTHLKAGPFSACARGARVSAQGTRRHVDRAPVSFGPGGEQEILERAAEAQVEFAQVRIERAEVAPHVRVQVGRAVGLVSRHAEAHGRSGIAKRNQSLRDS